MLAIDVGVEGPTPDPPLPQTSPLHPLGVIVVGAVTVTVLLAEHTTVFAVAESRELKLYVVVEVGFTRMVAPDPIDVPPQVAAPNQFIVYGDVPPEGPDVSLEYWPLVIAVSDSVIRPAVCTELNPRSAYDDARTSFVVALSVITTFAAIVFPRTHEGR